MYNVADLDRKKNAEICDDKKFLESGEGDIHLKADPMLKETSLWLQIDHDHVQELNLHDDVHEDCTSSFDEAFSFHVFQSEVESTPIDVKDQCFSGDEYYDESRLFGKECWISMYMHASILKFGIKRVIIKQWLGAISLRYALLIRKGSYFSKPVNGFA